VGGVTDLRRGVGIGEQKQETLTLIIMHAFSSLPLSQGRRVGDEGHSLYLKRTYVVEMGPSSETWGVD
jgi:hypothetical protein